MGYCPQVSRGEKGYRDAEKLKVFALWGEAILLFEEGMRGNEGGCSVINKRR